MWLGNIADSFSLVTLVVSTLTYFKVQSETKKLRQTLKKLPLVDNLDELIKFCNGINSPKPIALRFSLTPTVGSIKTPIQNFLIAQGWNMPIEEIEMNGINPQNLQDFYQEIRKKKRELEVQGFTEVHLFLSGPVQAGSIVGCLFSHWMPVKLYHLKQGGTYEYWMPLIKM